MSKNNQTRILKLCLLGSVAVGKSSIARRFVLDEFKEEEATTVGAAFMDKTIEYKDKIYKFQIWDTAGQEKYAPLAHMYYRDAHIALLVYDITDETSFDRVKAWVDILRDGSEKKILLVFVANKSDLASEKVVDEGVAKQYANSQDALYAYTSAKDDIGISEMFNAICGKLYELEKEEETKVKTQNMIEKKNQTSAQLNKNINLTHRTSCNANQNDEKSAGNPCCS